MHLHINNYVYLDTNGHMYLYIYCHKYLDNIHKQEAGESDLLLSLFRQ